MSTPLTKFLLASSNIERTYKDSAGSDSRRSLESYTASQEVTGDPVNGTGLARGGKQH
jgi:hypothetical protein